MAEALQDNEHPPGRSIRTIAMPTPPLTALLRSHAQEARNVLVVIRAYAEALERRHADPSFRRELGQVMDESVSRLTAVLETLETLQAGSETAGEDDAE